MPTDIDSQYLRQNGSLPLNSHQYDETILEIRCQGELCAVIEEIDVTRSASQEMDNCNAQRISFAIVGSLSQHAIGYRLDLTIPDSMLRLAD